MLHAVATVLTALVIMLVVLVILGGNLYHWDWLQLLIIPAVLTIGGYIINLTISRGAQEATKRIYSGTQLMLPVLRISQ